MAIRLLTDAEIGMRRREFIAGVGSATLWPAVAPAQQPTSPVRRIGTLMGWANAGSNHANFEAFVERLAELNWIEGRNVHIEQRWTDANVERARTFAKELVSQRPDVPSREPPRRLSHFPGKP